MAYIVIGGLWHTAIRPQEERELRALFPAFDQYKASVRRGVPRRTPYRAERQVGPMKSA